MSNLLPDNANLTRIFKIVRYVYNLSTEKNQANNFKCAGIRGLSWNSSSTVNACTT